MAEHECLELLELFESKQKYGTVKAYFRSGWNYVDLVSITIQIICMVMWGLFVLVHAETFEISDKPGGRYDVYHDPDNSKANFLRLYGNCYSYLPPGEDEVRTSLLPRVQHMQRMHRLGMRHARA